MKVIACQTMCTMKADYGIRDDLCNRISKTQLDDQTAEIQACLSKLKQLVPSVPQNKKISKVQLLQHVIDYILDLELALDPVEIEPVVVCTAAASSLTRLPLAEKSQPNTFISTFSDSESLSVHCDSRPPSK